MKKITRILVTTVGFGLVATVLGLLNSRPAPAQFPPAPLPVVQVKVTNTPLPVQGSVSASISNTVSVAGAVNANVTNTVPVSGTVAVSNLPSVSNVTVGNGATNPAMVGNVNDSVDREFSGYICEADYFNPPDCSGNVISDPAGNLQSVTSFTIPSATNSGLKVTQAVIEYISGVCRADTTDDIVEVGIQGIPSVGISPEAPVRTPGVAREVFPVPGQNSPTTWSFSHTAKIYLPPGTNISLFVRSTGAPTQSNQLEKCYLNFWGTLLTQ
jgi:hypothetical protein